MKHYLLLFAIIITLSGCSGTGRKFFEYDAITHYHTDIDDNGVYDLMAERESPKDPVSPKARVILYDYPKKTTDSLWVAQLPELGFTQKEVPAQKFKAIDSIFVEKKVQDAMFTSCIYIYRDVLIFKKKGKITGVAKVCFQCGGYYIIGTTANTENFGQEGGYWKLKALLEE